MGVDPLRPLLDLLRKAFNSAQSGALTNAGNRADENDDCLDRLEPGNGVICCLIEEILEPRLVVGEMANAPTEVIEPVEDPLECWCCRLGDVGKDVAKVDDDVGDW